ncbi:hypothetical protein FSP39_008181 [Pinctada imbricata]|uniref:COR domain-containing protein n=1 Tax=Pinctada imbricata TaxID=66713 RepID=A0AA89CBP4_PINIB|nr:hypothetical protein FSP39_008181 [Pinctada imbricata]
MVVGHCGAGKTTLVRGLLERNQANIQSTDGIDVYKEMCYIKDGEWKIQDFLMYWIGAIFYYSGRLKEGYPKIIIVGTHKDQVELKSLEMEIKSTFNEYILSGQLICSLDSFVNAKSMTGDDRKKLRYLIQEQGKSYPCFGDKVPKTWVDIQQKLRRDFRDNDVFILSVDELKNVCNDLGLSMKENDYFLFLEFYTNLGQMLYFRESALKDHVILEPMWLIMKILITQEARFKHAEKIGEITREEIQQCLASDDQQYIKKIDHVLKVLDRLDLVCNPKTYDHFGSNLPAEFYYIPSIFKESGLIVPDPTYIDMEQITYSFEGQILPPAVYHRLVCSYMSRWKIHEKHLYCETVQFQIQDDILVRFRRQQHQFLVTLYFTGERGTDDIQDVTSRVHHYVLETFDRIVKTYTRSNESKSPSVHYEGNISLESKVTEIKKGSLFSPKKERSLRGSFLPEKVKSRNVTDEFLDTVAYRIGTKYFLVGVSLGLEIDEVIVIVNDNPMQTLKINQEVLQNWSRKEIAMGRYPTYGMLASVFVDANCRIDDFPME